MAGQNGSKRHGLGKFDAYVFRVRSNLTRFGERLVNLAFTGQILFRFSGYGIKFDEKDTQPNAAKNSCKFANLTATKSNLTKDGTKTIP